MGCRKEQTVLLLCIIMQLIGGAYLLHCPRYEKHQALKSGLLNIRAICRLGNLALDDRICLNGLKPSGMYCATGTCNMFGFNCDGHCFTGDDHIDGEEDFELKCDTKSLEERQKICQYYRIEEEYLEQHSNLKRNVPSPVELDKHTNSTKEMPTSIELDKQANLTKEVPSLVELDKQTNLTKEVLSSESKIQIQITVHDPVELEKHTNLTKEVPSPDKTKNNTDMPNQVPSPIPTVVTVQPKPSQLKKYGWGKFEHLESNIKRVCPWMADLS